MIKVNYLIFKSFFLLYILDGLYAKKLPNILLIVAEDHPISTVGAYSKELVQTPNIDKLFKNGLKFEHALVTNGIATPGEGSLLTGKYSHMNGLINNTSIFNAS